MKYQVGDRVRIVSEWCDGCYQNKFGKMDKWLGKIMTIISVDYDCEFYQMREDESEQNGFGWHWYESSIKELVHREKSK